MNPFKKKKSPERNQELIVITPEILPNNLPAVSEEQKNDITGFVQENKTELGNLVADSVQKLMSGEYKSLAELSQDVFKKVFAMDKPKELNTTDEIKELTDGK